MNPNTALPSMAEILRQERIAIVERSDDRDAAALMWATACAQEAITIWRAVHPQMEREMLAHLMKSSK